MSEEHVEICCITRIARFYTLYLSNDQPFICSHERIVPHHNLKKNCKNALTIRGAIFAARVHSLLDQCMDETKKCILVKTFRGFYLHILYRIMDFLRLPAGKYIDNISR